MNGTAHAAAASGTGPVVDVADYAARVRTHLAGLPQDQVEDLTDGLEADLADALADESAGAAGAAGAPGDLVARFGDPADYARELRLAAGLPEPAPTRPARGPRAWGPALAGSVRSGRRRMAADLDAQPWWPPVRDFLVAVRPVWWFARAWIVYEVLVLATGRRSGWVPRDLVQLLLLGGLVVLSVQWGRGRWLPRRAPWLTAVASVVAVVLVVPAVILAGDGERARFGGANAYPEYIEETPDDGVWVDGMQVSNLFVYDAAGNPLSDVQVYDDRGRPVRTTSDGGWGQWSLPGVDDLWTFVPVRDADGRRLWNVYPLRGGPSEEFNWGAVAGDEVEDGLTGEPRTPPRPFAQAPALVGLDDGAEDAAPAQPGQDGSPAPTATDAPVPTPTATP